MIGVHIVVHNLLLGVSKVCSTITFSTLQLMQAKMFWTRLFLVYPVYSDIVFLAFEIKISCGYTVGRRRSEIVQ